MSATPAQKRRARSAVMIAKSAGRLVAPERCEECGLPVALHAHHEDYTRPLDVIWLCQPCHRAAHGWAQGSSGPIDELKALLGCTTDLELSRQFTPAKAPATVRLWRSDGMSRVALHELRRLTKDRGIELSPEFMLDLLFGTADWRTKQRLAA